MTPTEPVDLYVIARLDDAAVADLYSCEVFYDATDGTDTGRAVQGWWETVSATPASLDALDQALTTGGYRRVGDWRKRVTASGAVRWFTTALTHVEDLDR